MPKKILLITNIDRGQSNAFLATCDALLRADPDVELHFATFPGFEAAVASTWQHTRLTASGARPIVFHKIKGLSMAEGMEHYYTSNKIQSKTFIPDSCTAPLGFFNTIQAIRDAMPILVPYDGPQLTEVFSSISEIITAVSADLVVVDTLMTPALTACCHLGVHFVCLSPNAIRDVAGATQPRAASLWKYPA
jgi:hypothetical protein